MTRREILYLILSFIVTILLLLVVVAALILSQKPDVQIVWKQNQTETQAAAEKQKGKWEDKEKVAIALVKNFQVPAPPPKDAPKGRPRKEEPELITLKELAESSFFEDTFQLGGMKREGWQARYLKDAYYFVTWRYRDGLVGTGPTWLVDVKNKKVMPKDALAAAALNPAQAKEQAKIEQQVISSITNHTFESGLNLGGVMLIHFANILEKQKDDSILGWTVVHEYDDIYRAYFQWLDNGEPTYAEFEFDYGDKALRGRNLQAANLMQLGQSYEKTERVQILPTTYNPDADRPADRWTGASRAACAKPDNKDRCDALASILQDRELVSALEWLLTAAVDSPEQLEQCKESRACSWKPEKLESGGYRIHYVYNLDPKADPAKEQTVTWDIDLKAKPPRITPQGRLSEMAYRAVHTRASLSGGSAPAPEGG